MKSRSEINRDMLDKKLSPEDIEWLLRKPGCEGEFVAQRFYKDLDVGVDYLTQRNITSLLILGGGSGVEAAYLSMRLPQAKITNTDISSQYVQIAEQRRRITGSHYLNVVANAESLPFPSCSFEAVLICGAFHHIGRQDDAFVEMCRVADRSILFISEQVWSLSRLVARLLDLEHKEYDGYYPYSIRLGDLDRQAKDRGFRRTRTIRYFADQFVPGFLKHGDRAAFGMGFFSAFNRLFGSVGPWAHLIFERMAGGGVVSCE